MRKAFVVHLALSSLVLLPITAQAMASSQAGKSAARAEKALSKKKLTTAIEEAEAAVAAAPRDADYRMLLGRAYLENGRFASAAASFGDALALDSGRGAAALSLALTRLGLGDRDGARAVLDAHGALIPDGDRGLALALTGDSAGGVAMLEAAVRGGSSDAKTRQNLALSYALAGRWAEAKLMASYDLDPATLSQRIMDWSRFTREAQSSSQVAALLGVRPGEDAGQPVQLALNIPAATVQLAEAAPPPPAMMIEAPPVEIVAAEAQALLTPAPTGIVFAPRSEVVQAIAKVSPVAAAVLPKAQPARFQRAAFVRPGAGRYVVQIGAFDSMAVAQDAWDRAVTRVAALKGFTPSATTFVKGSTIFHRLSVSGFETRTVAVEFCEQFRARGGKCFVREAAGDAPLAWAGRSGGPRFAAR